MKPENKGNSNSAEMSGVLKTRKIREFKEKGETMFVLETRNPQTYRREISVKRQGAV